MIKMDNSVCMKIPFFLTGLALSLLACRPVLAVGWEEVLFVILLITFLLGPPLFHLYTRWEKFKSSLTRKEKEK
jgi:hypothetical protein